MAPAFEVGVPKRWGSGSVPIIVVGELINASRKAIREMIETENAEGVIRVAQDQKERKADYIDVNAGVFAEREIEYLRWLVIIVQS